MMMLRCVLPGILIIFIQTNVCAQETIARLKFEEAEEAFSKEDFRTAIAKLDEAENILGSTNSRILYLRIMAESNIIRYENFDFQMLERAREHCAYYLKQYEGNGSIEDKYRDVYKVSEYLRKYPADQGSFDVFMQARRREEEQWRAEERAFAGIRDFAHRVSTQLGFTPGINRNEYISRQDATFSKITLATPVRSEMHYSRKIGLSIAALFAEGHNGYTTDASGKVFHTSYIIQSSKNDLPASQQVFEQYKKEVSQWMRSGLIDFRESTQFKMKGIVIGVPAPAKGKVVTHYITISLIQVEKHSYVTLACSTRKSTAYYGLN